MASALTVNNPGPFSGEVGQILRIIYYVGDCKSKIFSDSKTIDKILYDEVWNIIPNIFRNILIKEVLSKNTRIPKENYREFQLMLEAYQSYYYIFKYMMYIWDPIISSSSEFSNLSEFNMKFHLELRRFLSYISINVGSPMWLAELFRKNYYGEPKDFNHLKNILADWFDLRCFGFNMVSTIINRFTEGIIDQYDEIDLDDETIRDVCLKILSTVENITVSHPHLFTEDHDSRGYYPWASILHNHKYGTNIPKLIIDSDHAYVINRVPVWELEWPVLYSEGVLIRKLLILAQRPTLDPSTTEQSTIERLTTCIKISSDFTQKRKLDRLNTWQRFSGHYLR